MAIDFFKDEETVTEPYFGLCDDKDEAGKTPAYADTDANNTGKWVAKVTNMSGKPIGFIAIDNKIEIKRENGEMENRCDAMLHNDDYIVFVELKDERMDWIKHAVEDQLLTTINIFKANHDIMRYPHRLAYACNRCHPKFHVSHKEYMQRFKNENKVRLIISCDIKLK